MSKKAKAAPNLPHYTYRVTWSEPDQEHVGLCAEFPSLSHLDADAGAALAGIQELVAFALEDMRANDEEIPEPIATRDYSGQFQVRISPRLHRSLDIEARETNRSLNSIVEARLAAAPPAPLARTGTKVKRTGRRTESA